MPALPRDFCRKKSNAARPSKSEFYVWTFVSRVPRVYLLRQWQRIGRAWLPRCFVPARYALKPRRKRIGFDLTTFCAASPAQAFPPHRAKGRRVLCKYLAAAGCREGRMAGATRRAGCARRSSRATDERERKKGAAAFRLCQKSCTSGPGRSGKPFPCSAA
jgi:hypothetical protein